jgi:hypothetical protein
MTKKGQISIFIIIGVFLLISVSFLIYINNSSQERDSGDLIIKGSNIDTIRQSLEFYYTECIKDQVISSLIVTPYGSREDFRNHLKQNLSVLVPKNCKSPIELLNKYGAELIFTNYTGSNITLDEKNETLIVKTIYNNNFYIGDSILYFETFLNTLSLKQTATLNIDNNGIMLSDQNFTSLERKFKLYIREGTKITDNIGTPTIKNISIKSLFIFEGDSNPNYANLDFIHYELSPHDIQFDNDIFFTLNVSNLDPSISFNDIDFIKTSSGTSNSVIEAIDATGQQIIGHFNTFSDTKIVNIAQTLLQMSQGTQGSKTKFISGSKNSYVDLESDVTKQGYTDIKEIGYSVIDQSQINSLGLPAVGLNLYKNDNKYIISQSGYSDESDTLESNGYILDSKINNIIAPFSKMEGINPLRLGGGLHAKNNSYFSLAGSTQEGEFKDEDYFNYEILGDIGNYEDYESNGAIGFILSDTPLEIGSLSSSDTTGILYRYFREIFVVTAYPTNETCKTCIDDCLGNDGRNYCVSNGLASCSLKCNDINTCIQTCKTDSDCTGLQNLTTSNHLYFIDGFDTDFSESYLEERCYKKEGSLGRIYKEEVSQTIELSVVQTNKLINGLDDYASHTLVTSEINLGDTVQLNKLGYIFPLAPENFPGFEDSTKILFRLDNDSYKLSTGKKEINDKGPMGYVFTKPLSFSYPPKSDCAIYCVTGPIPEHCKSYVDSNCNFGSSNGANGGIGSSTGNSNPIQDSSKSLSISSSNYNPIIDEYVNLYDYYDSSEPNRIKWMFETDDVGQGYKIINHPNNIFESGNSHYSLPTLLLGGPETNSDGSTYWIKPFTDLPYSETGYKYKVFLPPGTFRFNFFLKNTQTDVRTVFKINNPPDCIYCSTSYEDTIFSDIMNGPSGEEVLSGNEYYVANADGTLTISNGIALIKPEGYLGNPGYLDEGLWLYVYTYKGVENVNTMQFLPTINKTKYTQWYNNYDWCEDSYKLDTYCNQFCSNENNIPDRCKYIFDANDDCKVKRCGVSNPANNVNVNLSSGHDEYYSLHSEEIGVSYKDSNDNLIIEKRTGFKAQYDITDSKIACNSLNSCNLEDSAVIPLPFIGLGEPGILPPNDKKNKFRIFVPEGTLFINLVMFMPQVNVGTSVKFNEIPECKQCNKNFEDISFTREDSFPFSTFEKQEVYLQNSDGHINIYTLALQPPDNNGKSIPWTKPGWLYINNFYTGDQIAQIGYSIKVEKEAYENWYNNYDWQNDPYGINK